LGRFRLAKPRFAPGTNAPLAHPWAAALRKQARDDINR